MKKLTLLMTVMLVSMLLCFSSSSYAMSGAIFTTDIVCNGTNVNIFGSKDDVYLDGGPTHPGSAGLPEGAYSVKVTEPDGTLLGTSIGSGIDKPVYVNFNGEFADCYQLAAILIKDSDGTPGYDDSTNGGGVYKVWVSRNSSFPGPLTKTDNFKVQSNGGGTEEAQLEVIKFFDANVNGENDDGQEISGWRIVITDETTYIRYTPVDIIILPDEYTVSEDSPAEPNWVPTTSTSVTITLEDGDHETVEFGNVCLGPGGGHTLGFWSNKNGKRVMNDSTSMDSELLMLRDLYLKDDSGHDFDPASYGDFRSWLRAKRAKNMSYMLSAQLAAMALNVEAEFVSGDAMVYAPALLQFDPTPTGLNPLGFIGIDDLIEAADIELYNHPSANSGDEWRSYQEALKNVLDSANNNMNFVQPTPCPFTFLE